MDLHTTRLAAGIPGMLAHLPVRREELPTPLLEAFTDREEGGEEEGKEEEEKQAAPNRKRKREEQEEKGQSKKTRWDVRPASLSTNSAPPALAPPTLLPNPNLASESTPVTSTGSLPATSTVPAPNIAFTLANAPISATGTSARDRARDTARTPDIPAQERARRERLEYQRQVQERLRAQTACMQEAKRDLDKQQERKNKMLEKERQRQVTRQWWKLPASSSTMAWVHSGGARGTTQGEVRQWSGQANESMMGNANNTTINLDSTQEETEVIELDQTLTEEINVTLEEREEDTTTRARANKGEKDKKGEGKGRGV